MRNRRFGGFSLIEMIAVLTLLIVVSSLAIASFRAPSQEAAYQSRYLTFKAYVDLMDTQIALSQGDAETVAKAFWSEFGEMQSNPQTWDPTRDGHSTSFGIPGNRSSFVDQTVFQFAVWVRDYPGAVTPIAGTPAWCAYWDFEPSGSTYQLNGNPTVFRSGQITGPVTIRKDIADATGVSWRTATTFTSCKA